MAMLDEYPPRICGIEPLSLGNVQKFQDVRICVCTKFTKLLQFVHSKIIWFLSFEVIKLMKVSCIIFLWRDTNAPDVTIRLFRGCSIGMRSMKCEKNNSFVELSRNNAHRFVIE